MLNEFETHRSSYSCRDLSDYAWEAAKLFSVFTEALGKKPEEVGPDEKILFQDSYEMSTAVIAIAETISDTPERDPYYVESKINKNRCGLEYSSRVIMNASVAANIYRAVKETDPLFIYADPLVRALYESDTNNIDSGPIPFQNKQHGLAFLRSRRLYLAVRKNGVGPAHCPEGVQSYVREWLKNWEYFIKLFKVGPEKNPEKVASEPGTAKRTERLVRGIRSGSTSSTILN